jgi:ribosomal protein S11
MGGAGAAAGRAATSAAVSGGLGLVTERSQTAEADAQHAAREIAKQLAKFFVEQRWITQDQADKLFWDR